MAQFWTKKKQTKDEKTIQSSDFMDRLAKAKRTSEERVESPKIENTK